MLCAPLAQGPVFEMASLRAASLGSGSKGNATLIEAGQTCVMVDCGFSGKEAQRRLAQLGRSPAQLSAIVVTHEHSDHVSGVARLARQFDIPVWLTAGTLRGAPALDQIDTGIVRYEEPLVIGDLELLPFSVPHDAREPCHFVFDDGGSKVAVLTDLGHVTDKIVDTLRRCDALMIEANHDARMLEEGPYPAQLKDRVGGSRGHLNNDQTAGLLQRLDCSRLRWVCGLHLSEQNNTPDLARAAISSAMECDASEILIATQRSGLPWQQIG